MLTIIEITEKFLSYKGDTEYALRLVESIRLAYNGADMPKMLNDFIFGLEVALQDVGVLDDGFNVKTTEQEYYMNKPNTEFCCGNCQQGRSKCNCYDVDFDLQDSPETFIMAGIFVVVVIAVSAVVAALLYTVL